MWNAHEGWTYDSNHSFIYTTIRTTSLCELSPINTIQNSMAQHPRRQSPSIYYSYARPSECLDEQKELISDKF
jgi:hypothetical protein